MPSRIRMIPPSSSALLLYFVPKMLPIFTPRAESRKVITPMKLTAGRMRTSRKAKHGLDPQGEVHMLGVPVLGFPDHVAADKAQKDHGDPVVHRGDVLREAAAQQVADERHQGLKASEPEAHDHHVLPLYPADGQALADGHGEGVHGQAHGQNKQFQYRHARYLLSKAPCILLNIP